MADKKPRKQLGELLKEKGLITEDHIKYALQEQKITRERLGELFERLGFVTEHDVVVTLSEQSGVPHIDVDALIPENDVLKIFNKNFCLSNGFYRFAKKTAPLKSLRLMSPMTRLPSVFRGKRV